jgi:DNA-directed RNA polymerase specialized sigma subunit
LRRAARRPTCSIDALERERWASAGRGQDPVDALSLHEALCALDDSDRCVVEGYYFEEKSDVDVADACGLASPAAVRQRRSRAVKKLADYLSQP